MNGGPTSARKDGFFAGAVIGAIFAMLAFKTWLKWPDLLVDFGAQIYMPWQISTGAVLYRDVNYLAGGPLSQYYHGLLFKIFGVSFLTLVLSNLVVVVLLTAVIYLCFYRWANQLIAITACVSVLVVFAFPEYTMEGIFNYITPYSAEVVHGLALSVLAVALLARWFETENPQVAGAAGFCGGLVLLTKPEIFLALIMAVAAATALFWHVKRNGRVLGRSLALMAAAGMIPAAGFFLWFFRVESFRESVRSVLAAWVPLLTTSAADSPFYRWCLGLDRTSFHLHHILRQFCGLAGLLALCALASWRAIPARLAWVLAALLALVLIKVSWDFDWFWCGYVLLPVCLALLALQIWRGCRSGWEPPVVFATLWAFWSLAMLAKLGVFCRIWHYGFALAMPAFVSALYFLLWALPWQLERCGARPAIFRALVWMLLLPGLARLTQASLNLYPFKTVPLGSGADTIVSFDPNFRPKDGDVAAALRWVEINVPPRATMAVLPQGALIAYLTRHPNPFGYVGWTPPELAAFGQEKMTRALMEHSPDYVIEYCVDYHEYGVPFFGLEKRFGLEAQQWIEAHYHSVCLIGHDWLKDGQFGIKILQKNR
jgi:hypothetical protein